MEYNDRQVGSIVRGVSSVPTAEVIGLTVNVCIRRARTRGNKPGKAFRIRHSPQLQDQKWKPFS
jgi:hypothetical protein